MEETKTDLSPVPDKTEAGPNGNAAENPGEAAAAAAATAAANAASAIQREERNRILRERQNEERQRKLEELKQHALATQKFREQQEEERRRRMEEQRLRDLERRNQVEERKRAILEAERERREALLRRSEDRGVRQEIKKRNERGAIAFAFGSSTPRMLEPIEGPSSYWGARRATSTTNVMSSSTSPRVLTAAESSSMATPTNSRHQQRASSVFGLDQNQEGNSGGRMAQSLHQDIIWGDSSGQRPHTSPRSGEYSTQPMWSSSFGSRHQLHGSLFGAGCFLLGDDLMTQSTSAVLGGSQAGRRKRTDLIPTLPVHRVEDGRSPRAGQFSHHHTPSSSSRGSVTRSTGMSVSLSRLDQLSQPRRLRTASQANPSPLKALHENGTKLFGSPRSRSRNAMHGSPSTTPSRTSGRTISKSMSHLAPGPNRKAAATVSPSAAYPLVARLTRAERLRQKARLQGIASSSPRSNAGLRSGDVTPSSPTRPLSALSQVSSASTTVASSGHYHVRARTAPAGGRKPRPISIAGTGMSLSDAARANRASRESINSARERSKETKEKENAEKARQPRSTTAATPTTTAPTGPSRPPRARSADMRNKESKNSHPAPAEATANPTPAKRVTKETSKTAKSSSITKSGKTAKTPVEEVMTTTTTSVPVPKSEVEESVPKVETENVETVVVETVESVEQKEPEVITLDGSNQEEGDEASRTIIMSTTEEKPPTPMAVDEKPVSSTSSPQPDVEEQHSLDSSVQIVAEPISSSADSGTTTPSETGSVSGDVSNNAPQVSQSRKVIASEEEAKAALAEKRRLAREQMEREAERERLRLEEEQRLEEERLRQEELEQRLAEEEMDRLAKEAREAEEERLRKAIEERERQEEEERLRREEEVRQRAEKELQEKKAREEAERARKENDERLRREEEERQERRKRVEAIMARTRGKSGNNGPTNNGKGSTNDLATGNSNPDASNGTPVVNVTASVMSTSISQPDLLGDLVNNKAATNGDDSKRNNGFHDGNASPPSTSVMPDVSVVITDATDELVA